MSPQARGDRPGTPLIRPQGDRDLSFRREHYVPVDRYPVDVGLPPPGPPHGHPHCFAAGAEPEVHPGIVAAGVAVSRACDPTLPLSPGLDRYDGSQDPALALWVAGE